MCGIAGILYKKGTPDKQKANITRMLSTLQHRGPDGWGVYSSQNMTLGHARLSIIDLNSGSQPMMSDRYAISYNGELFNYIELRKEINSKFGVHFETTSDTEVILKSFEVYGFEALKKFNGQFAILLWDRKEKRLIIARDRFGIRPLYILSHNNSFFFASEMKAFDTVPGFQRTFKIENLVDHGLYWNSLKSDTVYNDIQSLPAGTFEIYQADTPPKRFRYYQIGESEKRPPENFETALDEFKALLDDSVRLRLRSDVPVGTYLSGGIDSSVISHLTARHTTRKFKTFSVSFSDKTYDESSFQKTMVKQLHSDHSDLEINYDTINEYFMDAVYHFERPVFRTAPLPLFLLSDKVRKEQIKVVLTGEGADEILFGYDSFKELKLLEAWSQDPRSESIPRMIKKLYPHLQHYKDPKKFGLIRMYYEGFLENYNNELAGLNIRIHNNKALLKYFNKDLLASSSRYSFDRQTEQIKSILPDNFSKWSLLQKNQFLEFKTLLSGYLLSSQGDRMSMAHSVEGRYPFLDHRIVETLFYYPDHFKLNNFKQKYLLGKAYASDIPDSIINRPKRPYMAPDLVSFFKNGHLTEQAEYFLCEKTIDNYGIFNNKLVQRLIKKFEKNMPEEIGYRDNMLFIFILSSQIAKYWTLNPKSNELNNQLKTTDINDYE